MPKKKVSEYKLKYCPNCGKSHKDWETIAKCGYDKNCRISKKKR